ncbi:MAG: hypothetical protein WKF97_06215 [Chitinophagaceae bacterium]
MISLFKHTTNKKENRQNVVQDRIATGIFIRTIRIQERYAGLMQRKSEHLSMPVKKYLLIAFCFLSSAYSIYIIAESFGIQEQTSFSFQTIISPQHIGKAGNEIMNPNTLVTLKENQKVQRFLYYMDSLAQTSSGKKIHYRILTSRPGLMDSIRLIENMYHIQSLKK